MRIFLFLCLIFLGSNPLLASEEAGKSTKKLSQYRGVSWHKGHGKWVAQIFYAGKNHHLGVFTDEKKGAEAYDAAASEHHKERAILNFPSSQRITSAASVGSATTRRISSQYRGVCCYKGKPGRWVAKIFYAGKTHYLGLFESEEEAARAYDAAAIEHHKEKPILNFPKSSKRLRREKKALGDTPESSRIVFVIQTTTPLPPVIIRGQQNCGSAWMRVEDFLASEEYRCLVEENRRGQSAQDFKRALMRADYFLDSEEYRQLVEKNRKVITNTFLTNRALSLPLF